MQNKFVTNVIKRLGSIFIRDGNFRPIFRYIFVIVGVALIFLDLEFWRTWWLGLFGFVIGGVGGYSARAHQLGIRPFESPPYPAGWLKDRKNEKNNDDQDE
ncbi:hypothetical protein [Achromobacter mucicolens]|uniref:hypothetical protein n=1 Tax=Achromobacter mucicolens TaxID=1389922 RepID=UPI001581D80B|nr:hypothetical protein [Achromobacter mucicolens]